MAGMVAVVVGAVVAATADGGLGTGNGLGGALRRDGPGPARLTLGSLARSRSRRPRHASSARPGRTGAVGKDHC